MHTTMARWATGLVLILATLSGCGSGAATVDDLAKAAKGVDDAARLAEDLKAVNGGKTKIDPKVLERFESSGVTDDVMETIEPVVDLACDAFDQDQRTLVAQPDQTSQEWLNSMWREADQGQSYKDAIKFACAVNEFKSNAAF